MSIHATLSVLTCVFVTREPDTICHLSEEFAWTSVTVTNKCKDTVFQMHCIIYIYDDITRDNSKRQRIGLSPTVPAAIINDRLGFHTADRRAWYWRRLAVFVLPGKQADGSAAGVTVVHPTLTRPHEPRPVLLQSFTFIYIIQKRHLLRLVPIGGLLWWCVLLCFVLSLCGIASCKRCVTYRKHLHRDLSLQGGCCTTGAMASGKEGFLLIGFQQ